MNARSAHAHFNALLSQFARTYDVSGVTLILSPYDCYDATHGFVCEPRSLAWCFPNTRQVYLARRALELSAHNIDGVLLHELGHVFDPCWCVSGAERRADIIAERATGQRVYYDRNDVQTTQRGTYPRPKRLPR